MGATMVKNGNFLDALPSQGTLHVVMLGLDSAGKTTALYRLKFDQYLNTVPTIGFNCEKVQGTVGKAKGVHFLVWDVGGQEKLRPLWRSYTRYINKFDIKSADRQISYKDAKEYLYICIRCTDGILFVVDSVDTERMEEAKMELMRTAKCPDNQGVPVLILANKQDLPNACCPKELEKLLGLQELHNPITNGIPTPSISTSSGNIVGYNNTPNQSNTDYCKNSTNYFNASVEQLPTNFKKCSEKLETQNTGSTFQHGGKNCCAPADTTTINRSTIKHNSLKGWYIQPACAITGEGLQEGLDALYDMILKRRKICKTHKKNKR